jgi:hypothetical protein
MQLLHNLGGYLYLSYAVSSELIAVFVVLCTSGITFGHI